ncbi:hypothetical protein CAter282_4627 [Collimonas arenae]|uniref:Uncharacterized protein n=1 Tax=Collimonas arenae TaxID=279058 RepID=A0A127QRK9_9BURK|nr:hypothetical protein [Collimonas arenae]AMP02386.1 hypothetical protein CAter10_5032 [Collimonas arenae]AMP12282.1 hypothetical protein CAter282_4627 [Collimonas arenae]
MYKLRSALPVDFRIATTSPRASLKKANTFPTLALPLITGLNAAPQQNCLHDKLANKYSAIALPFLLHAFT